MDANLFRLPTHPNLYPGKRIQQASNSGHIPTDDSRFPGWAAPLQDGRLVTDYRSNREKNIPVDAQEKTRIWMQHNTDAIIRLSRQRLAERTGMVYGVDTSIVPGAIETVTCIPSGCVMTKNSGIDAIGTERADSKAPELFGTYIVSAPLRYTIPNVEITRRYEGGRNSLRG